MPVKGLSLKSQEKGQTICSLLVELPRARAYKITGGHRLARTDCSARGDGRMCREAMPPLKQGRGEASEFCYRLTRHKDPNISTHQSDRQHLA